MQAGTRPPAKAPPARAAVAARAPRARLPCLILPGFLATNTTAPASQYSELAQNLVVAGVQEAQVLPVSLQDWLPVLRGGSFAAYLDRLVECALALSDKHGSRISLVGVSAGGWLARLALGQPEQPYEGRLLGLAGRGVVDTLVTLGTPHASLERYPFGRAQERWLLEQQAADSKGATESSSSSSSSVAGSPGLATSLAFCNSAYPDAASLAAARVVCVCGAAAKGDEVRLAELAPSLLQAGGLRALQARWLVAVSYEANCGSPGVEGDGVVPLESAALPGAEPLVLPGVWHSAAPGRLWYGSAAAVAQWAHVLP